MNLDRRQKRQLNQAIDNLAGSMPFLRESCLQPLFELACDLDASVSEIETAVVELIDHYDLRYGWQDGELKAILINHANTVCRQLRLMRSAWAA